MPEIPFPTSSAPSIRPQAAGGRLINAFAVKAPLGSPGQFMWRRSAGLDYVCSAPDGFHTRGFLDGGNFAYWALDDKLFRIDSDFKITLLGPLEGQEPVTMARNFGVPSEAVVVTENGCFNLVPDGPPTAFADSDLQTNPTSVCEFDGYLVWSYGNGKIYASDLNSAEVNALSFNTEQGLNIRRVVRHSGRLFAFGDKWTAVYKNAGTSPFPFAKENVIPRGIIGTHAIAGWEYGWVNTLIWAGDDFKVYKLNGYLPEPISTADVSRDIQESVLLGDRDFIEAYVYMYEGNPFWVLTSHDQWTWEYNLITNEWNERKSFLRPCWRGMKTIRIFDEWLVGDHFEGHLYRIRDNRAEYDLPLIWFVESGVAHAFPNRTMIPKASFNIATGVGNVDEEWPIDPKVLISYSLDGGHTWGQPLVRKLGGPGQTMSFPSIINCGVSRGQGIRFRLQISDPIQIAFFGGTIDEIQARKWAG